MKKTLIVSFLLAGGMISTECHGEEIMQLHGSWKCHEYEQNEGEIRGSVSGEIHFLKTNELKVNHTYQYVFEAMGGVIFRFEAFRKLERNGRRFY